MVKFVFDLPFLFGDHHVIEVKKLLEKITGVAETYVSSSFHTVEVTYNPDLTGPEAFIACLEEAGYIGEAIIPEEIGVSSTSDKMNSPFFRKTNVYDATPKVVSFRQSLVLLNRRVWPIPGFGAVLSVKHTK